MQNIGLLLWKSNEGVWLKRSQTAASLKVNALQYICLGQQCPGGLLEKCRFFFFFIHVFVCLFHYFFGSADAAAVHALGRMYPSGWVMCGRHNSICPRARKSRLWTQSHQWSWPCSVVIRPSSGSHSSLFATAASDWPACVPAFVLLKTVARSSCTGQPSIRWSTETALFSRTFLKLCMLLGIQSHVPIVNKDVLFLRTSIIKISLVVWLNCRCRCDTFFSFFRVLSVEWFRNTGYVTFI